MAKSKQPRLGRGLNSLMSAQVAVDPDQADKAAESTQPADTTGPKTEAEGEEAATQPPKPSRQGGGKARLPDVDPEEASREGLHWVAVDQIESNPYQPRCTFDRGTLEQLAESIRQDGVMQPIVVRPHPSTRRKGQYQLVAGERRHLAAQMAELKQIPAIVRQMDDRKLAEWAVIENLQREELNPIDRAEAFHRLIDRFGLSHQDVADRVGVNRSTVTNFLRVLELQEDVREMLRSGQLSSGHARALLGLSDAGAQRSLAERATAGGWSVRAVEQGVRQAQQAAEPASSQKSKKTPGSRSAHLADLEQQAAEQLGTKVRIKPGRKKNSGTLAIEFYDLDQFDRLLQQLGVNIE